ncbi:MAG: hypothetical protein Udaeo2_05140 [Candidatus Udaeobacter sp.]|nr:MAG: hypothetical protein Udaeo2_05140 [Candidatus Udaeobacter sp.]
MLPNGTIRNELISLADLFGIATEAAGECSVREGVNVLKMLRGECAPREYLVGMVESPGSHDFKLMVVRMSGNIFSWQTEAGNSFSISGKTQTSCRTASDLLLGSGTSCML